jgi:hypothetical protein
MIGQALWTVFPHCTVVSYLYTATDELRAAVKSLQHGIPAGAYKLQDHPETWEWIEARHYITFVIIDRDKRRIGVTEIESTTVT